MLFTMLSKTPCLKEELSPEVPLNPPPTVMFLNSIMTGATSPYGNVASTNFSMETLGSTMATRFSGSILRISKDFT
ncbi:hypothetical protein KCU83_g423, partial [Aureobasidium melanogenum]